LALARPLVAICAPARAEVVRKYLRFISVNPGVYSIVRKFKPLAYARGSVAAIGDA